MLVQPSDIQKIVKELSGVRVKVCDTETYGLKYTDSAFSFSIGYGDRFWYFNFKDYPEINITGLKISSCIEDIRDIFSDKNDTWVFHNAKFDLHKLDGLGISVAGSVYCTKQKQRIIQNNLLDYSLKALSQSGEKKSDEVEKYISDNNLVTKLRIPGKQKELAIKHFDKVPLYLIKKYAIQDTIATLSLYNRQQEIFANDSSLDRVNKIDTALTKHIFNTEKIGIKLDVPYVKTAWSHEENIINELKRDFLLKTDLVYDEATKKDFIRMLEQAGEKIEYSDKNNPVLDKEALDKMASPLANIIKRIRFHEKRISSFYSTFIYYKDDYDIIHPHIDIGGTETGRFSMSSPNLQQLSKKDSVEKEDTAQYSVRGCFVPRDGKLFVNIDYSQQEYCLMADYAGEKYLINAINSGHDVHQATAELLGISRSQAKTVNFGVLYGCSVSVLADMLKVPISKAAAIRDSYFYTLRKVERFIQIVKERGASRKFVFNWVGRKMHISDRNFAYILPNHLIQGSGADVMKVAICRVGNYISNNNLSMKMVLTVHDSLVLEMDISEVSHVRHIQDIMESVYISNNGIKLRTDVEYSFKSLAEKDMIKGLP